MIRLLGIEGTWPPSALVIWGAAVVTDGHRVWNSLTKHGVTGGSLQELATDNAYFALPEAISLEDDHRASELVLVAVKDHFLSHHFKPDVGRIGGYVGGRRKAPVQYYVFEDDRSFAQYAAETAVTVAAEILLQAHPPKEYVQILLRNALTLRPLDPQLHAIRVIYASNRERTLGLAQAAMASDTDRSLLLELVAGATLEPTDYHLKYQDGVAAGGGLDAGQAANQFVALDKLHAKLLPHLQAEVPLLDAPADYPTFRVTRLEAASADISLSTKVVDEPLLYRISRYLELRLFQRILEGDIPLELRDDAEFQSVLQTLASPSPDTKVFHRPFGEQDVQEVVFEPTLLRDARPDVSLTLLGFTQGVLRELRRIEVRLTQTVRHTLSLDDDGTGRAPIGTDQFRAGNAFLFAPVVIDVQRYLDDRDREKYFLRRAHTLVGDGDDAISAIASSVVSGAYLLNESHEVRLSNGHLVVDHRILREPDSGSTYVGAMDWLLRFSELGLDLEVAAAHNPAAKWVRPSRMSAPSAVMRVLLVLTDLGQPTRLPALITAVNERFVTAVRRNNTRREILRNPDLIEYVDEREEVVQLTERGRALAVIHQRIYDSPLRRT